MQPRFEDSSDPDPANAGDSDRGLNSDQTREEAAKAAEGEEGEELSKGVSAAISGQDGSTAAKEQSAASALSEIVTYSHPKIGI